MRIEIDTKCEEVGALDALAGLLGDLVKLRRAQDAQVAEDDGGTIPTFTYVPAAVAPVVATPVVAAPAVAAPAVAAPVVAAPAVAAPPRPPVSLDLTGDVELDSAGAPWDGRIHSVGKSKVANGTWRLRRGVDPEAVKVAEAEHQVAPPPPPSSVPSVPAASVMSFGTLMQLITARTVSGEMSPGEVAAKLREAGLPTIPVLASRPDLIGQAAHALGFAL